MSQEHAANATAIELVQCAESHCRAFLVSSAYEMTKDIHKKLSPELTKIIHQLIELYAIDTCMKCLGDLLRVCIFYLHTRYFDDSKNYYSLDKNSQFTTITEKEIQHLQVKLENVLAQIRPNAVGIVDGFDIPDGILCSALGMSMSNILSLVWFIVRGAIIFSKWA